MAKKHQPQSSELHPGPGFRVRTRITRSDAALVAQFGEFATPDISDLLNRLYTMNRTIKYMAGDPNLTGTAVTVKVFPGDNLMVHKALDVIKPGDVIVVDAGGSELNGIIGDMIANKAKHLGATGFIIDGLIRDLPMVKEVGLPVFARGTTPIGPLHRGPGEINFAVSCGGIVVNPGDIICADEDGVVVVRQDFAADLLARLQTQTEASAAYVANVQRGIFSLDWVNDALAAQNCLFIDGND